MIKNILTVGDSFTYGEELADRNHSWPFLLANKLSANVTNMARPGSGNKRMIRYVMEHVADATPLDLVVVGWSSPGRIEFADEDGFLKYPEFC
jgi:lysophospholipase L1-like esterase